MSNTQDDPFKTLAISKIWQNAKIEDIKVEELGPDTYQLTWVQLEVSQPDQHVRVELQRTIGANAANRQNLRARAAALHFFGEELGASTGDGIPTPRLVHYDRAGVGDELNRPYLIHQNHPGIPAARLFEDLSGEQRALLAEKLGDLYRRILEVDVVKSGPSRYKGDEWGRLDFKSQRIVSIPTTALQDIPGSPTFALLANHLLYTSERVAANEVIYTPSDRYIKALTVLEAMEGYDGDGLFKGVTSLLVDAGLGPMTIMLDKETRRAVEYDPSPDTSLGPAFMACRPPAWLWNRKALEVWNIDPYQEWKEPESGCLEAVTEDDIEVKKMFDKAAGPKYQRFAYEPAYKLARRLAWWVLGFKNLRSDGFYDEETREAQDLLDKWNAFAMSR